MISDSRPRHQIDYPIRPEHHPPMYLMHKWWARKPHNIIAEYINAYSFPNEVVFDPFMGSGVVPIEAIHLGRRAMALDINPMSTFITENTGKPCNIESLYDQYKLIKRNCGPLRTTLYSTNCPQCHSMSEITHQIFKHTKDSDICQEIWIKCKKCGIVVISNDEYSEIYFSLVKQQQILNDQYDRIKNEHSLDVPVVNFVYTEKNKFLQLRHALIKNPDGNLLFTKRALLMLSKIRKEILTLPDPEIRNLFLFAFSSTLGQASKMVWVIEKRKGKQVHKQVGSWTHHFFWNPHKYFEVNSWNCFEERVNKLIRGKIDANSWFEDSNRLRCWQELRETGTCHLEHCSDIGKSGNQIQPLPWKIAKSPYDIFESIGTVFLGTRAIQDIQLKEPNQFLPESVDLIVTDPPYGDSIQYYELSKLWNEWLGFSSSSKQEIVINSRQAKDLAYYQSQLKQAFQQCYRILKPERYLIVTFHNNSLDIRNALISAILCVGFELQHILFQIPPRRSLKAYLHPKGTPIGDYYIRFYKGKSISINHHVSEDQIEPIVRNILSEILKSRGEPTLLLWIANLVDSSFARAGLFPFPKHMNLERICSQSNEFSMKDGYLWLHKAPESNTVPLTTRINAVLKEFFTGLPRPFTKLQKNNATWHILQKFSGDLTPDPLIIQDLIVRIENE